MYSLTQSSLPHFPSSPSFLIYYHLSLLLSSLPHLHYPPSPSWISLPLSFFLSLSLSIFLPSASFASTLLSSWRCSGGPDLVVLGFQMVWLANGSKLTPLQLIISYLKPQGIREGTHFSGRMRGRGQQERTALQLNLSFTAYRPQTF